MLDKIADIIDDELMPVTYVPKEASFIIATKILALLEGERCVWKHEEIWYPCLYYTSCGKYLREEFNEDKPYCPCCGKKIEVSP